MGFKIGYKRVSTTEQNDARQLDGMTFDRVYTDKASGGDRNRPELVAMLENAREGDHIYVHALDRFARDLSDLVAMLKELSERGISITLVSENMTFGPEAGNNPMEQAMNAAMVQMLGVFSQFELSMNKIRRTEGIEKAKAAGKYKGRKPKADTALADQVKALVAKGMNKKAIAKELGIGRTTLYKALKVA